MNNPLRHVGQTARPEESQQLEGQGGDTSADSLPQHPREKPAGPEANAKPLAGKKDMPDLKPGEAPPESSAGS